MKMHFLVVGCGSIGQRHISNLLELGNQVTGCDLNSEQARQAGLKFSIQTYTDLNEALNESYTGALICTRTSSHISVAIEVAKKGIHLFIEKPLSHNEDRIGELQDIVDKNNLTVLVGCNMRFLPSLQLVKRLIDDNKIGKVLSARVECGFYLPFWHPEEDYRKEYSANKSMGGGVIFDDIHEIDTLVWLFGNVKKLFCFTETTGSIEIDTEDIAEILLKFQNGVTAQIHLDYLSKTYRRQFIFTGEKGDIVWDFIHKTVRLYGMQTNHWEDFHEGINTNLDVMYVNEMKHFINCINKEEKSVKDLAMARQVLGIAMACYESAQKEEMIHYDYSHHSSANELNTLAQ